MEEQGYHNRIATDVDAATTFETIPVQTGNAKWDMMYMRLVQYKNEHDDCLVPNRYKPDTQLGSWVSTQRRHYKLLKSGKESALSQERLDLLTKLGFVWATRDPRHVSSTPNTGQQQEISINRLKFVLSLVITLISYRFLGNSAIKNSWTLNKNLGTAKSQWVMRRMCNCQIGCPLKGKNGNHLN